MFYVDGEFKCFGAGQPFLPVVEIYQTGPLNYLMGGSRCGVALPHIHLQQ